MQRAFTWFPEHSMCTVHLSSDNNTSVNSHWLLLSLKNNITYELGERARGCCIFVYLLHFWLNETLVSYILVFYRALKWFCSETTGSYNSKSVWFWRKNFLFTGSWLVTNYVRVVLQERDQIAQHNFFQDSTQMLYVLTFLLTWERNWHCLNLYWNCLCVLKMAYLDLSFSGVSNVNFHPAIRASFPLCRHVTQLYEKFLKAVKLIPARGQWAAIFIVLQEVLLPAFQFPHCLLLK